MHRQRPELVRGGSYRERFAQVALAGHLELWGSEERQGLAGEPEQVEASELGVRGRGDRVGGLEPGAAHAETSVGDQCGRLSRGSARERQALFLQGSSEQRVRLVVVSRTEEELAGFSQGVGALERGGLVSHPEPQVGRSSHLPTTRGHAGCESVDDRVGATELHHLAKEVVGHAERESADRLEGSGQQQAAPTTGLARGHQVQPDRRRLASAEERVR